MIVGIQIRNYKAIQKSPWISLNPFHVLVGPNGSGKSTFLDAIEFIKACLVDGPVKAIQKSPWISLNPFHVLVGPNGSGKSTFLDAIEFIKACLVDGPVKAVEQRAPEFRDLTFMREGGPIEFDLYLRFLEPPVNELGRLHYRVGFMADERLGVRVSEELLEQAPRRGPVRESDAA